MKNKKERFRGDIIKESSKKAPEQSRESALVKTGGGGGAEKECIPAFEERKRNNIQGKKKGKKNIMNFVIGQSCSAYSDSDLERKCIIIGSRKLIEASKFD